MAVLIGRDAETYGDYIVINSARSDVGSADGRERWVVLCNEPEGGSAETAIVVEIERSGRKVLGFRRAGDRTLEPHLP